MKPEPSHALASRVIDLALERQRPYAVFMGRSVEIVPADGKRFARLQSQPARMALCAGVFTGKSSVDEVVAAIVAAGGA